MSEPVVPLLSAHQLRRIADLLDRLNSFENGQEAELEANHQLVGLRTIIEIVDPKDPETVFGYADASLVGEYLFTTDPSGS